MRFKFIPLFLFLFFISVGVQATNTVDSLKTLLENSTSTDRKAKLLSALAEQYSQNNNYRKAVATCKKLLRLSTTMEDSTHRGMAYDILGLSYLQTDQTDSSLYYYRKAVPYYQSKQNTLKLGGIYNNMSIVCRQLRKLSLSLEYAKKCLEVRKQTGQPEEEGHGHLQVAYVYDELGQFSKALEHNIKAIEKYQDVDFVVGIINAQNNLALLYNAMDRPKDQIKTLEKNLQLIIEQDLQKRLCSGYYNLANAYKLDQQFDKAEAHYQKALSIATEQNKTYAKGVALFNYGDLLLQKGKSAKAIKHYTQAKQLFTEIGFKNGLLHVHMSMGDALQTQDAHQLAVSHYTKALEMARAIENIKVYPKIHQGIADAYKALGNHQARSEHLEHHILFKDSLLQEQNQKEMARLEARYQTEKKQLKIKNLEKEKALKEAQLNKKAAEAKRQNLQKTLFAGGFLGTLLLAFVIYRGYKRKKRNNKLISQQKSLVEQKNKEIFDSINYAKRIQSAILPSRALFDKYLPESFIFYRPKEIVSGDFYWILPPTSEHSTLFAAADCTGHGVPGAMVSVMCSNALTKPVKELGIYQPAKILYKAAAIIEERFELSDQSVKDGMDVALVKLHPSNHKTKTTKVEFAGANNPLWVVSKRKKLKGLKKDATVRTLEKNGLYLHEIKADRQSVGKSEKRQPFTNHALTLQKGDTFYLFSDGYADQFGGPKGKKFMYKSFKKLLLQNTPYPLPEQKEIITRAFDQWKCDEEQVDDVCLIGVRV